MLQVWGETAGSGRLISSHWTMAGAEASAEKNFSEWERLTIKGRGTSRVYKPRLGVVACATHTWEHLSSHRWACSQCPQEFNWTCGHGGSAYICPNCYKETVTAWVQKYGSIEEFLAKNSWYRRV